MDLLQRTRFLQQKCIQKQQINYSEEQLERLFPSRIVSLPSYLCVCMGSRHGIKTYEEFRILRSQRKPLVGSHEIIYRDQHYNVTSLHYFKNDILKFPGLVSFERCTFILIDKTLVRLSTIRSWIEIPLYDGSVFHPQSIPQVTTLRRPLDLDKKDEILQNLFQYLQQLYDCCEEENRSDDFQNLIEQVMEYIVELKYDEDLDVLFGYVNFYDLGISSPSPSPVSQTMPYLTEASSPLSPAGEALLNNY